jgi:hypothetical protein
MGSAGHQRYRRSIIQLVHWWHHVSGSSASVCHAGPLHVLCMPLPHSMPTRLTCFNCGDACLATADQTLLAWSCLCALAHACKAWMYLALCDNMLKHIMQQLCEPGLRLTLQHQCFS